MISWLRYLIAILVGVGLGFLPNYFRVSIPPEKAGEASSMSPPTNPTHIETASTTLERSQSTVSTLAEIMLIPGDFAQTVALYNLGGSASVLQIEKLLGEAASLSLVNDRRAAGSILYARYAELDPQSAVNYLLNNKGAFSDSWLNIIFYAWSRQNLDEAIAGAVKLDLVSRELAVVALLNARDDLSHDERLEIAKLLGMESVMSRLESQRYMALAKSDPQTAWQSAVSLDNKQLRTRRLFAVTRVWARSDPQAALLAVASTETKYQSSLQLQILAEWGRTNSQDAIGWVLAQEPSVERSQMLMMAFQGLSVREPQRALSQAMNLGGDESNAVMGDILQNWIRTDLESAMEWYKNGSGNIDSSLVSNVALAYAQQKPQEAFEWAISLPLHESMTASLNIISVTSMTDSVLASKLAERIVDKKTRMSAANLTVSTWAQSDPVATGEWIQTIDSLEERTPLYYSLFQHWLRSDGTAAANFFSQLPAGIERDKVAEKMIMRLNGKPRIAERLYDGIETADYRKRAARKMYFLLRKTNPTRAEKYRLVAGIYKEQ